MLPYHQATGTAANGIGAISPAWPTHRLDDVALLFVESCGGEAISLSTAAGFVEITNSPQNTGTTTNGTRLAVFWCRATGASMGAPTIADPGDHVRAVILTFRNVIRSGNPWDVTAGSVKAAASTSVTFDSVTTTVDGCLVINAAARDTDSATAAFSAWANAALGGLRELHDAGTTDGNGGGLGIAAGYKHKAGATGATTATVSSSINAMLTIALKPQTPSAGDIKIDNLDFVRQSTQDITRSFTVGAQANRILVVLASTQDSNGTNRPLDGTNGVSYGGTNLTKLRSDDPSTRDVRTEIWYMLNPPTGTANVVTNNVGAVGEHAITIISLYNVDQNAPNANAGQAPVTNSSEPNIAITTTVPRAVILAVACSQADFTGATRARQGIMAIQKDQSFENHATSIARVNEDGAHTMGLSTSFGTDSWCISAVALKPAVTNTDETLTVSGTGNNSGWNAEGGDYTRLQSDDGGTTRRYTPTALAEEMVLVTDPTLTFAGATINWLKVYAKFESQDPVENTFQIGVRVGSTNYYGEVLSNSDDNVYRLFAEVWDVSPATGVAWTETELDALQIGARKINTAGGALTYMYAVVNYTAGAGGEEYTITLDEAVVLVDTINKQTSRTLLETATLVDTVIKSTARALTETVTLVDTIRKTTSRTLTDVVTMVDTVTKQTTKVLGETVTLVDTVIRQVSRIFTETVTLVDTAIKSLQRTLSETVVLVDTVTNVKLALKTLEETVTLVDTFIRNIFKTLTDTITPVDTVTKTFSRMLTETVTVTDGIIKVVSKIFTETVSLTDSVIRQINRTFQETVTLVDNVVRQVSRTFQETITLVDTLTYLLTTKVRKGITILLSKGTKAITMLNSKRKNILGSKHNDKTVL